MAEREAAPGLMAEALGLAGLRPRASQVVRLPQPAGGDCRELIRELRSLRLGGMAQALEELGRSDQPLAQGLSLMLERERQVRKLRLMHRRIKQARLRHPARIKDVDCSPARGLGPELWRCLASCGFVRAKKNLLITGPTGVGKTFIACALADQVCRMGLKARYARLPELLTETLAARRDGTWPKTLAALGKADLLVLDDWGIAPMSGQDCLDLHEVAEKRRGRGSVIIVSQQPLDRCPGVLGDSPLAEAVWDRLSAGGLILKLRGASRRGFGDSAGKA